MMFTVMRLTFPMGPREQTEINWPFTLLLVSCKEGPPYYMSCLVILARPLSPVVKTGVPNARPC